MGQTKLFEMDQGGVRKMAFPIGIYLETLGLVILLTLL